MSTGSFDHLSPQGLSAFTLGLAGLPKEEILKAKRLYVLDAITKYEAMRQQLKAFAVMQIVFAIIPCFWPILLMQRSAMNTAQASARQLILNALEVWRDDLGEHYDDLRSRIDPDAAPR